MENYIGEIRAFAIDKIPSGWIACNGQKLQTQDKANQPLYALIGNLYGGDSKTFFNVPDLRGRASLGKGKYSTGPNPNDYIYYNWGQSGGAEGITLTAASAPSHYHSFFVSNLNGSAVLDPAKPGSEFIAARPQVPQIDNEDIWVFTTPFTTLHTVQLNPGMVATVGGGAHENRMPYLPLQLCIALTGVFPNRSDLSTTKTEMP